MIGWKKLVHYSTGHFSEPKKRKDAVEGQVDKSKCFCTFFVIGTESYDSFSAMCNTVVYLF